MRTRSAVAFGVACFATGTVVGVLLTPARSERHEAPPPQKDVTPAPRFVASGAPIQPGNELQAEVALLRATVAMAQSECSSRFAAAGCVSYIPWPTGSDPVGTARRIEETLRDCPNVDPASVHVECDEYPCAAAFVDTENDDEWLHCAAFRDLMLELNPRFHTRGTVRMARGGRAHMMTFSASYEDSHDMVDAIALRSDDRYRALKQNFMAKLRPGDLLE